MILILLSSLVVSIFSGVLNVKTFGAKGDGKTFDTVAIQKTFSAAAMSPGSTVFFPKPGKYLTSPFNLTSDTTVYVEVGATILGAQDKSMYPVIAPLPSYGKSRDVGFTRYQPLVFGVHLRNVTITGGGTIDGQGQYWWDLHKSHQLKIGRPRLVELMWSSTIEVSEVRLQNSGFWTLHPVYCKDVWIHHITIRNPSDSPNTDGIDPDSSSNVLIEHVDVSVGDDHIAIKSGMNDAGLSYNWPTRNVTVRNSDFYDGMGISIGSETSGGIFDVYVHDCTTHLEFNRFLYIKTGRGRGNTVANIRYENLRVKEFVGTLLTIDMTWGGLPPTHNVTTTPTIANVTYSKIRGIGGVYGKFICLPESPCHGIHLDDVDLVAVVGYKCQYAYGSEVNTHPKTCLIEEK